MCVGAVLPIYPLTSIFICLFLLLVFVAVWICCFPCPSKGKSRPSRPIADMRALSLVETFSTTVQKTGRRQYCTKTYKRECKQFASKCNVNHVAGIASDSSSSSNDDGVGGTFGDGLEYQLEQCCFSEAAAVAHGQVCNYCANSCGRRPGGSRPLPFVSD